MSEASHHKRLNRARFLLIVTEALPENEDKLIENTKMFFFLNLVTSSSGGNSFVSAFANAPFTAVLTAFFEASWPIIQPLGTPAGGPKKLNGPNWPLVSLTNTKNAITPNNGRFIFRAVFTWFKSLYVSLEIFKIINILSFVRMSSNNLLMLWISSCTVFIERKISYHRFVWRD